MANDAYFYQCGEDIIRADGVLIVPEERVSDLLLEGVPLNKVRVDVNSATVTQFNTLVPQDALKYFDFDEPVMLNFTWNIPDEFLNIDVKGLIDEKFAASTISPGEMDIRKQRIEDEYALYAVNGMLDLLRTVIFIIDTFKRQNLVWGVGRGSSCASYILYLLGLHQVDPIKYRISIDEFFG